MKSIKGKPSGTQWLDNTLLCILLGLIILRTMAIEAPHIDQFQTRFFISSKIVSLLVSSSMLVCIGLWFWISLLRGQLRWRKTGFGPAVCVFIIAGILATIFASHKRAAVTDLVTLATPMLAGLLLVQLLSSAVKIRLALLLILAVGAAATVECFDQQIASNQTLIEDYEANPTAHLEKMGIDPDSMEHWMYEHRLYSRDIRGFLMTSNSAASFFLFAVFAGLGLCLQSLRKYMSQEAIAAIVTYLLALGVVLCGLFLTQSKGGIGAFALGVIVLILLLILGRTLWRHRRIIGILVLLLIVVAGGVIIYYGLQHGRLPGGNSMLVRWQYWVGAAKMIADHGLTGVGGGNFPTFYTQYKLPAASETVQDPHNWGLSLLSRYGIVGLAAFLAAVLLPLHNVCSRLFSNNDLVFNLSSNPQRKNLWIGLLAVCAMMLLFIRPILVDTEFLYQRVDVRSAAYFVLYIIPAGVFIFAFILLRAASAGDDSVSGQNDRLAIALVCGLIAVLIHNLIDFAIFEPGIFGVFWLFIAILVAQMHNNTEPPPNTITLEPPRRLGLFAGLLLASIIYLVVVLLQPLRAEHNFKQAMRNDVRRIELIETAIAADPLSFKTAYQAAGLFTQTYQQQTKKDNRFLVKASDFARTAAKRNPADFKPWRLLGEIQTLLAVHTEGQQKQGHLQAAFDDTQQAIIRYPGSGKLHYKQAQIAEQLGQNDSALEHYQKAIEIEDAYRAQFRIMYPERETVISRLGQASYTIAKSKIEALQKQVEEK